MTRVESICVINNGSKDEGLAWFLFIFFTSSLRVPHQHQPILLQHFTECILKMFSGLGCSLELQCPVYFHSAPVALIVRESCLASALVCVIYQVPQTASCFLRLLYLTVSVQVLLGTELWRFFQFLLLEQNYTMQRRNCDTLVGIEIVWRRGGNARAVNNIHWGGSTLVLVYQ